MLIFCQRLSPTFLIYMRSVDITIVKNLFNLSKGYFLTTIINQALPFLLLPILTRFLSTSEYGMLSLITFYMSISTAIVGISIPTVIAKYFYEWKKEDIAKLVGNCFFFSLMLVGLMELLILVLYPLIGKFLSMSLELLVIMPIASFCSVIFSSGLTICRLLHRVIHFSCHQVGNTLINVFLSLFTVCIFMLGWIGRYGSICVAFILSAIIMLFYLKNNGYLYFSYSRNLQKKIAKVVLPLIPNSVQLNLISQAGLFFMQLYFGKDILGRYAMAFQISFCVKLLIDTINMSWSPYLYKQLSKGKDIDKVYIARCLLVLILVLFLGTIFINVLALPILWLMTTPDYYSSIEFIPWFTFGWLIYGVYTFMQPILIKSNQQKLVGLSSLFSAIVMIFVNVIGARLIGYMGISYAFSIVYVSLAIPLIIRAQKISNLPWQKAICFW